LDFSPADARHQNSRHSRIHQFAFLIGYIGLTIENMLRPSRKASVAITFAAARADAQERCTRKPRNRQHPASSDAKTKKEARERGDFRGNSRGKHLWTCAHRGANRIAAMPAAKQLDKG
jgi:hypothetical protein